jgi:hypothetical protein
MLGENCKDKKCPVFICLGNLDNIEAIFTDVVSIGSCDKIADFIGITATVAIMRFIEPVSR